jgi:hypothetical protein
MNDSEKSKGSWWQTIPGILTAITGILTATAGLLVALHQVGILGNKEKPGIQSPSTYNDTARSSETTLSPATPITVTFPAGTEVTLHSNRGEGTYKVLAAQVEARGTGELSLKLSIRLTNKGPADLGFWSDSFRLVIDGVPRAPTSWLNDLVDARSAKESDVMFDLSDTAERVLLRVSEGKETAEIPMILSRRPAAGR